MKQGIRDRSGSSRRSDVSGCVRRALGLISACRPLPVVAGSIIATGAHAALFPAEINLATLLEANGGDGSVGFVQRGLEIGDSAGRAVSTAGDLNDDGIEDFVVGAGGQGEGGRG
mgnify:CR=1 FL=1